MAMQRAAPQLSMLEDGDEAAASAALEHLLWNEPATTLPAIVPLLRKRPRLLKVATKLVSEVAKGAGWRACAALEPALVDAEPELRLFATRVLARVEHRRAFTLLATASNDSDARVREWGVLGLSRLGEERPSRVIAPVWGSPSRESLRAALGSPEPFVRERAADLLGDARASSDADVLRARLRDDSPAVRAAAARALAALPDPQSARDILAAHDDPFWGPHPGGNPLRLDLAWAAAVLGDATLLERLVEIEAGHVRIKPEAAETLGSALEAMVDRLGAQAVDPLCRRLASGGGPAKLAAALLGRVDDTRVQAALVEALEGNDVELAGAAARALATFAPAGLLPRLLATASSLQFDESTSPSSFDSRSPEALAGALDLCLMRVMERNRAALPEAVLNLALGLPTFPGEAQGCEIVKRPGFDGTWLAARSELDRRAKGLPAVPLMRFWEMVSAFRDQGAAIREAVKSDRWREPYFAWYVGFDELVARQNRAVLDHPVPLDLSRQLATSSTLRFVFDTVHRVVRREGETLAPGTPVHEMSARDVHDSFGGTVIEEVLESGSARID